MAKRRKIRSEDEVQNFPDNDEEVQDIENDGYTNYTRREKWQE